MAASRRAKHVHISIDSSSSDEEEKRKLQSSVWEPASASPVKSDSQKVSAPPSKREDPSESFNVDGDYRVAEMTPEYKSFVAKKLTSYLDEVLADKEDEDNTWQSRTKIPDVDESFKLFTTSSASYKPPKENLPQPPWKRKRKKRRNGDDESLSNSSDSEEERLRLQAASVSADFILRGASGPPVDDSNSKEREDQQDQVTLTPFSSVITNNTSSLDERELKSKKKKKKNKKAKHKDADSLNNISEVVMGEETTNKHERLKSKCETEGHVEVLSTDACQSPKLKPKSDKLQQETMTDWTKTSNCKKKRKKKEKYQIATASS